MTSVQKLKNGHKVEYDYFNCNGEQAVVLLHGLIGSAELSSEAQKLAKQYQVNLLSFARPGYGLSSNTDLGSICEVSLDGYHLLEILEIKNYSILAVSAGCPYGLAFQAFTNKPNTTVVISGLPAVYSGDVISQYSWSSQIFFYIFKYAPNLFTKFLLKGVVKQVTEIVGENDAGVRASLANEMAGLIREVKLQQKDWGFNVATLSNVHWFHGKNDEQVPLAAVQETMNYMSGVSLHIEEDLRHFPEMKHWHKVFKMFSSL